MKQRLAKLSYIKASLHMVLYKTIKYFQNMQWTLKNTIYTDICALKETVDVSLISSFLKEHHTYKMSEKQNEIRRSKTAKIIIKIMIIKRENMS